MDQEFSTSIENSTAHRPIRDLLSGQVLDNPALFPVLLETALTVSDKNHHKACWILELVLEARIEWLEPYLEKFCNSLFSFSSDSAIRSISKIGLFAVKHHIKTNYRFLSREQVQQITEACFDWLINPEGKVAAKAYAMRVLFLIGKNEEWIYPELARVLSEDFMKHTAAYKAASREILKKINR